jgi:uncharacterized phage protein gp47/JayE
MTTYPLATLGCTISETGISAPIYADILASMQASFQNIYGADVYLQPDSQDGQWLAVLAYYYNQCNSMVIAAYNSFSPATAVGAALSSNVKINGLERDTSSNSTVVITVGGTAGAPLTNAALSDPNNNVWLLPASVNIPDSGSIEVTATAQLPGAITLASGVVMTILTPTRGWQTAATAAVAEPGAPVETDAQLRARQAISTSQPAQSTLAAIIGAVGAVAGVSAVQGYENVTGGVDGNGAPASAVYIVATGGAVQDIVNAIGARTLGQPTYGTTNGVYTDPNGATKTVNYFETTQERIVVNLTIQAKAGYLASTGAAIIAALQAAVAALGIGQNVEFFGDLAAAAVLSDPALAATYNITALTAGIYGSAAAAADVSIPFNGQPGLAATDVNLTVTPST